MSVWLFPSNGHVHWTSVMDLIQLIHCIYENYLIVFTQFLLYEFRLPVIHELEKKAHKFIHIPSTNCETNPYQPQHSHWDIVISLFTNAVCVKPVIRLWSHSFHSALFPFYPPPSQCLILNAVRHWFRRIGEQFLANFVNGVLLLIFEKTRSAVVYFIMFFTRSNEQYCCSRWQYSML